MKKESFDGLVGAGLVCLIVAVVIFIKSIFFGFNFSSNDKNDLVKSEQEVVIVDVDDDLIGPRGGVYHYSKSGKKVYHKK